MKKGLISNIQRFSTDDGPGIRTTVFLKGCNLHCVWCHNPECISAEKSLAYYEAKCAGCGRCVKVCPKKVHQLKNVDGKMVHIVHRENCDHCGKCVEECPEEALEIIGREMTAEEVLMEVNKDRDFYRSSGGGVTISGGEPMQQLSFLMELLPMLKQEGYHVAIDTAGAQNIDRYEQILEYVDLFLYDIKMFSEDRHKRYTGISNELIKENLKELADKKDVYVRIPMIPEINLEEQEIKKIIFFLQTISEGMKQVKILPYHSYGLGKYDSLGISALYAKEEVPKEEDMQQILNQFLQEKLPTIM